MTITSYGYDGSVNEVAWTKLSLFAGRRYGVLGVNDWEPHAAGVNRDVVIYPGTAFGHGVVDVSDANQTVSLPTVASGSQWFLIAIRRTWATNVSSLVYVAGGATKAIPARTQGPGVVDEQPLALFKVTANGAGGIISDSVDLRVWQGDGGAVARDELALSIGWGLGTKIHIGRDEWTVGLNSSGSAEQQVVRGSLKRTWWFPRVGSPGSPIDQWNNTQGKIGLVSGYIADAPAGEYLIQTRISMVMASGEPSAGVIYLDGTLGSDWSRADLSLVSNPISVPFGGHHNGGGLWLQISHSIGRGTAQIDNDGSGFRVSYLGP